MFLYRLIAGKDTREEQGNAKNMKDIKRARQRKGHKGHEEHKVIREMDKTR
jgi:hypothetical protein